MFFAIDSPVAPAPIYLGVIRTATGPTAGYYEIVKVALRMWLDHITQKGGILGRPVIPIISDTLGTVTGAINATQTLINDTEHPIDFIWSEDSGVVDQVMMVAERYHIPVLTRTAATSLFICGDGDTYRAQPPCTRPNSPRCRYAHTFFNLAFSYYTPFISLLKIKKAKSVAILSSSAVPAIKDAGISAQVSAHDNGMDVVYFQGGYNEELTTFDDLINIMKNIATTSPDGLILGTANCTKPIRAMKQINWLPKAICAWSCIDNILWTQILKDDVNYITSPAQWGLSSNWF